MMPSSRMRRGRIARNGMRVLGSCFVWLSVVVANGCSDNVEQAAPCVANLQTGTTIKITIVGYAAESGCVAGFGSSFEVGRSFTAVAVEASVRDADHADGD